MIVLGNIGSRHHQTSGDERKILKEYIRKTLFETKLRSKNLIKWINTSAVSFIRYLDHSWSEPEKNLNKWTTGQENQWRGIKPYNRDDVDRLHVSRNQRRRVLTNIEDSVDTSIQRLEDYIQKCGERLITVTRNNTDDTRIGRMKITRNQKWEEKQLYEHFKWQTSDSRKLRCG